MRAASLTLLCTLVLESGCSQFTQVETSPKFELCKRECAAVQSLKVPACVASRRVRSELAALLVNAEEVAQHLKLESGACGCLTGEFTADGRIDRVVVVHTERVAEPNKIVETIREIRTSGPIPEDAKCLVGVTVPITFHE
jgi:hypothetical protein